MANERVRVAVGLYALCVGLAIGLAFLRNDPDLFHHPAPLLSLPLWAELVAGVAAGAVLGFLVVWVSQRAVTSWRWAPALKLHNGLRQILCVSDAPFRERDVLILALSSSVAEEVLFRGWLLPATGLLISSLIFGALHFVPRERAMLLWIPMAVGVGLAFGGLFLVLGSLTAPVTAHFIINYKNLHFINSYDPAIVSLRNATPSEGGGRKVA